MKATAAPKKTRMEAGDRRAQLLEVAKRLFAASGFDGATTKEIAARAGVTEALIFRHFPSKDALYEAVIEEGVAKSRRRAWRESLFQSMEANDDEAFFRHLISFIIEIHRSDPTFQRLLVQATLGGHHTALRYVRRVIDPLQKKLAEYAAKRQKDGAFREGDPMGIVTAVLGMGRNYAVAKYIYRQRGPKMTDAEAEELFLRIAMSGVTAPRRKRDPAAKR